MKENAELKQAGCSYALTVAYDGRPFAGFARQDAAATVQGCLEQALATVLRRPVETIGAGRTDAGVHALGQVVSFEAVTDEVDPPSLLRSLNALSGPSIVVTGVRQATRGFSARFDAEFREYRYRLIPGPVPPLFLAQVAWWVKVTLDLASMRNAAQMLVGEHDFRSFCVSESADGRSTTRRIDLLEITSDCELGEHCVVVRVIGNAFLHSMVRAIVGTLVEVGAGRRESAWVGEALEARTRSAAGPTAPARGLTLWHVSYPEECWL